MCVACEEPETSSDGEYSGTIVECTGNTADQDLTVVLMITNTGFNDAQYVGGATTGTMAIDSRGNTLKPLYESLGNYYEFPTGTTVRVTIENLGKIMPGTLMLQTLRVGIGSTNNQLEFNDVLIVWD
jgi:hypothetical protein